MRLDRTAAAAEFSFFVAIPTMSAAFAHEFLEVRDQLTPARERRNCRRLRHGVPLVAAHHQAVSRVRAARRDSRRSRGIASRLAWRCSRPSGQGGCGDDVVASPPVRHGVLRPGAGRHQHRRADLGVRRRRRLHGAALRAVFQANTTAPRCRPGSGIVTTAVLILLVGVVATNVLGKRVLQRAEGYLLRVPVFRTVYAPVKQLVLAFSPDNEYGFKRVVMIRTESRGYILGFLTKEFSIQSAGHTESLIAVYVPTNHLYLGDVVICRRDERVLSGPQRRGRDSRLPDRRYDAAGADRGQKY